MDEDLYILTMVNVIVLAIIIVLTLIYLLPIILVRRFHTASNILTGNYGVTGIICCTFLDYALSVKCL